MSVARPPMADWLPPAVLDRPEDAPATPRLLEAMLAAVERQRLLLVADIEQAWDDLFIESCADWAVPYIAALVGLPPDSGRHEVAYAVALRRRKGTPRALEDFARVLTGFTARAREGWKLAISAQRLDHAVTPASFDMRRRPRMSVTSPFDPAPRSVTPGGAVSPRAAGVVLWPWQLRTMRAVQALSTGNRRYSLHPFGLDAPLYIRPPTRTIAGDEPTGAADDERHVPVRATYPVLDALAAPGQITYGAAWTVSADHPLATPPAGAAGSRAPLISITVGSPPVEVPWTALRFTGIDAASAAPAAGEVLVDVNRGRLELGSSFDTGVRATWHRPVSGAVGALAAEARPDAAAQVVVAVNPALPDGEYSQKTIEKAIQKAEQRSTGLLPTEDEHGVDVEIRLETSDSLTAPPQQAFTPKLPRWRIVAPTLMTPAIKGALELDLKGACLTLEGFMLDGDLGLGAGLEGARLEGLTMNVAASRKVLVAAGAWALALEARRCILGPIRSDITAGAIRLEDCIVDGVGVKLTPCGPPPTRPTTQPAVSKRNQFAPSLEAAGCTFAGLVDVESIDARDCVFVDGVTALRQQEGCLVHCYLGPDTMPPASRPPDYRCVKSPAPRFSSDAFESGGYYALDLGETQPLLSAASDGGEVGAYHHTRRAASLARLRSRIHEFVPLGLRADVALATWEE